MSSLRRLFPGIALTCKGILLFMCGAALIALFAVSPVIFGCVPSVVSETDSGAAYPAGALVYHRYTPAETLAPGDAAVVYDAGRTTVCTILSRDDALRTLLTEGRGPIPFEHGGPGCFLRAACGKAGFALFRTWALDHSSRGGSPAACRCIFAAPLQLCAEIRQIG